MKGWHGRRRVSKLKPIVIPRSHEEMLSLLKTADAGLHPLTGEAQQHTIVSMLMLRGYSQSDAQQIAHDVRCAMRYALLRYGSLKVSNLLTVRAKVRKWKKEYRAGIVLDGDDSRKLVPELILKGTLSDNTRRDMYEMLESVEPGTTGYPIRGMYSPLEELLS